MSESKKSLPEIYRDARSIEQLLADKKTPSDVRAQLEVAMLEAAEEMGVTVLHSALVRQAFIEIFNESGERCRRGDTGSVHHFENATTRLLTIVHYAMGGHGPIDLDQEDRGSAETSIYYGYEPTGMEEHSRAAIDSFIKRAQCRELIAQPLKPYTHDQAALQGNK
jgi:hypothetical protein